MSTLAGAAAPARESVPLVPRTVLFGEPERRYPALSPAGDRIGYVAPVNGIANVWVQTIGRSDAGPVTDDRRRGVTNFCWSADGRYVLYLRDPEGREADHLHAIDLATGADRDLTPLPGIQARFIGTVPGRPEVILIGLNDRDPARHDVYEVELATGDRHRTVTNPGLAGWAYDRDLRVRAAYRWTPDGGLEVVVGPDGDGWRPVFRADPEDAPGTRVVAVTSDGQALLVISAAGAETARLLRVDLAGGTTAVVYADPGYDVVGAGLDPVTGEPDIAVVHRERRHLEALTPGAADRLAHVRRSARGDVMLIDRIGDDRWWLVLDFVAGGPSGYRLYDFGTGRHRVLFAHQPALARYVLAETVPFAYPTRDGLTVHGYLTFPPGVAARRLPTVLAVHGGPWTRDNWGSGGDAQWLANRGYLCVQVNYRGSTGYGRSLVSAGDREWGGRMQDDLVDAVRWLTREEYADPDRIAIYGASYGGYAALFGAVATPELYHCAIAVSAPTDLRTFVRTAITASPMLAPRLRRAIGDPDRDGDFLRERSPLTHARAVRIPILLAHGANDPRVPLSEADQFVAALRRHGTPHEYLVFPDEGHGFVAPRNRLAFFAAAERFLAQHLGGRYEQ